VAWLDEYEQLEQSCVDEGLLTKAFGKGNLRITKKRSTSLLLVVVAST
jgi:hypothetical protein